MKKLSAFVVLLLAIFTAVAAIAQTPDLPGARQPSITVAGTGESHGKPDFAQVQLGVVTEAPTAAEALRKNNEEMSQLIVMIRKRGIEDRDLQTVQFTVLVPFARPPLCSVNVPFSAWPARAGPVFVTSGTS